MLGSPLFFIFIQNLRYLPKQDGRTIEASSDEMAPSLLSFLPPFFFFSFSFFSSFFLVTPSSSFLFSFRSLFSSSLCPYLFFLPLFTTTAPTFHPPVRHTLLLLWLFYLFSTRARTLFKYKRL